MQRVPVVAFKFFLLVLLLGFAHVSTSAQQTAAPATTTLLPLADAYVRNGTYANTNYGSDTALAVKTNNTASTGYMRASYLKFSVGDSNVVSAKLRLYGRNMESTATINIHVYGLDNDAWTESGITWNNAPAAPQSTPTVVGVNSQAAYYEFDVTNYVKQQIAGDKIASFILNDPLKQNKVVFFNSKENAANPPQLVITYDSTVQPPSKTLSFAPDSLSYTVVQNNTVAGKTAMLSAGGDNPVVSLSKSLYSDWLVLPASPATGALSFGINAAGLSPGIYTSLVTATASGYSNATLHISLEVTTDSVVKSILFTQSTESVEVEQGGTQSLSEYISTSDANPVSVQLRAFDGDGKIPDWLTVNGKILNGINYTTGSEISFTLDATNLSIGKYTAKVSASAAGYDSAVLNIFLTVKAGSAGTLANLKVNFQDSATKTPAGWLRDFGQAFGTRTSPNQGTGNTYGWIKRSDNTPLDLTKNGRKRTSPADTLLATFMHMQANNLSNFSGTAIEGIWEAQVANGNYDVTVSVGDGTQTDSKHSINIEGVPAIINFAPTTMVRFRSATVSVTVADGLLTVDAIGGTNTKINYIIVKPTTTKRPSVVRLNPENSSQNVSENTSISSSILNLPNGGINNATITTDAVYLKEESTGVLVPSHVNGTGGGDAITLVPNAPLKLSTTYVFTITDSVKDLSGASFIPYSSSFTTGSVSAGQISNAKFDKVNLPNTVGRHSSLTIGPDGKLYALSIDGVIKRFAINPDGTLGDPELLYSLQDSYGMRQQTLAVGFAFDPAATASNLVAWVTHGTYLFLNAPDWDGKLTKLSGPNLENAQDVLVNLPRSAKDHVTNSIAFGPDGALYFTQGSTSAMGKADKTWSNREEHLLSAAVLRLDVTKLGTTLPLNVKTSEGGGTYNPYATNAPLTIYASGVRNAYDLVWHSNGELYTPTNGSAAGGNTPASVAGTVRTDGTTYNGPIVPALTNVQQTQKDFLFRIQKGGYYGHPNPLRGEYVINGGNPSSAIDPAQVDAYPVNTQPDKNWRGYAFDFQTNKSPNGAIEYKSNTFNGALKGKLLVVRYSQNDDIIALTPGGTTNDIVSYSEGAAIEGFSGFVDPLDLTEDIRNGNIYVSQYGGDGIITLLRPRVAAPAGVITVTPNTMYDNDVIGGSAGTSRKVTVKNSGTAPLTVSEITLGGTNANQFILSGLPALPKSINANDSISFTVAFNPSTTGLKTAALNIKSTDSTNPAVSVPLRALGTAGTGGTNEPSLQALLDLFQIPISVGDDDAATTVINSSATSQKAAVLGDEVSMPKFVKAGDGTVSIEPLAVFGPTAANPVLGMGWYKSGDSTTRQQLFTVSNSPASNGQTVNVNLTGSTAFDPGTAPFGFYTNWPFFNNRYLYSEDNLNTFAGSIPHHVRVYPYKDQNGLVANTFVVAFEENTSGFDYQDVIFIVRNVQNANALNVVVAPLADAYVRNGTYANTNYGGDTALMVKTYNASTGTTRNAYLKFPLNGVADVVSAKLRIYGSLTDKTVPVTLSAFGVDTDSWGEMAITANNAPASVPGALSSVSVGTQAQYYEFNVTDFAKAQFAKDKTVSLLVKDTTNKNIVLTFNSREQAFNTPQLVLTTSAVAQPGNTLLFVENLDKFPSNDYFVSSRIQVPWTRDTSVPIAYNANHDTVRVRIHNKGIAPLVVNKLVLSNPAAWKFLKLKGVAYDSATALPVSISSGTYADLTLQFIAPEQNTRVKLFHDNLTILSNDDKAPYKILYLNGLWQQRGEGSREPTAQEQISIFGFKTKTGFSGKDPDSGRLKIPKGDEIFSSFFVRADTSKPVYVIQMGAYHQCCDVQTESIRWYPKTSHTSVNTIVTHIALDAQSLLPRKGKPATPAEGSFNPTVPFGLRIGYNDYTDTLKNPQRRIGIRVWKAIDGNGKLIPNSYIISNDYLGTDVTNYDYNDNMYFVRNIKPELGTAYFSELGSTPSTVDFGEKLLQSADSFALNIKNLGQTYANGTSDPALTITSVVIAGENKSEFTAAMPATTTLDAQGSTAITIGFKPVSEGLKIADLLIYHSGSVLPYRVPLYGIAKASGTTVTVHYRINSGSATATTINGKTWSADNQYAFDNLEPFTNPKVANIAATDEDALYLDEQSSNADKKPFRYEMPVANGNYVVRLHFAEIYWGAPGTGVNGGAGSRVMSVKLENQLRLVNFDPVQEVGTAAALIKNIPVTVTDGKLNIDFSATANRPMVSAVEVYSFSSTMVLTSAQATPNKKAALISLQEADNSANNFEKPTVYPNPLHNRFYIKFPSVYTGSATLQITDVNGRVYEVGKSRLRVGGTNMEVDLSRLGLKPGVYFLRMLYDERKTEMIKLLVE